MPKTLHAVLIGINGYNREECRPLNGCINDALAVSDYFKKFCAAQKEPELKWEPLYLLAPADDEEKARIQSKGISYKPPTRENIIAAFREHFKKADPDRGDYCLLYYSGHGSFIDAPDLFADYEPTGFLQTTVCLDSRGPNGRDLLDKELGYLIAEVLEGKAPYEDDLHQKPGVHFLVISDSCFSGSNTRADEEGVNTRMQGRSQGIRKPEDILGFSWESNVFYKKVENGRVPLDGLQQARYINLSAARDNEEAKEKVFEVWEETQACGEKVKLGRHHGVFTYSLLRVLEQGGTDLTYGELMRRVEMEVRNRADKQIPVLGKTNFDDENLYFLRNEFKSPKPEFEVSCRDTMTGPEWYINGGAIQGIMLSAPGRKTLVQLTDGSRAPIEIVEVRSSESVLDKEAFTPADVDNRMLRAVIHQMAYPRTLVEPDKRLPDHFRDELSQAFGQEKLDYLELRTEGDRRAPDFIIRSIRDNEGKESLILTRPNSEVPLFQRNEQVKGFLKDVNKVGKWISATQLSNPGTEIPRTDIKVEVQAAEGEDITPRTFNALVAKEWSKKYEDPSEVTVRFIGTKQPAIKVRITNASESNEPYWVAGLYLDSHFGITDEYLECQELDSGQTANMGFAFNGQKYGGIPLDFNPMYHEQGVTEIEDHILLIVSRKKFQTDSFRQPPIQMDTFRSGGFTEVGVKEDDWFTIPIAVRLVYPLSAVEVPEGSLKKISRTYAQGKFNVPLQQEALSIQAPSDFSATVQAANRSSARRRLYPSDQGAFKSDLNERSLLPPGALWSGSEGSEAVFSRNLATSFGRAAKAVKRYFPAIWPLRRRTT